MSSARGTERGPAWLRTTAFRLTLLHLGLTLLTAVALSALGWWAATGFAARQIAQQVERDMGVLLASARLSGPAGVALAIEARIALDRTGTEYYLLAARDGTRLAGNLAEAPRIAGWQRLPLQGGPRGATEVAALGAALPGGAFLVAARDLAPVAALQAQLLGAAGWVGGGALLLGLGGGLLIGRGVARRAAAMEAALAAIEAGDMARRLAEGSGGDEFDRLARRINATLDRLAQLMATLRRVTDDIAHDLRTPLSRLRQRLEAMPPGAATEEAIAEADRILGIFAALLRIAQVEAGARRAGFARCDLSAIAATVAEVYAPAAEERGQTLDTAIAPGLALQGDPELVTQMLANLVENAIRHGREGGHVRIAAEAGAITVEDDGPGIPQDQHDNVLQRFTRLDTARSTEGAGLGLALVKAIVDLHGFTMTLEDADPGLRVRITT